MSSARIIAPADRPAPMRIAGFDIQTLDGAGPAPHCHQWDETFFVLQGPVAFGVGDQEQWIEAGTLLHVPGGERHWYRFGDQKGEFLSFTSGKAASPMYRELAGLPAEAPKLDYRAVAIRHGQTALPDS